MQQAPARENVAIIKDVGVSLGGRGDDVLEACVTVLGVAGVLEGFSATRFYTLKNPTGAGELENLMIATKSRNIRDLCGKVVKYENNVSGGVSKIYAIEGIYDNA